MVIVFTGIGMDVIMVILAGFCMRRLQNVNSRIIVSENLPANFTTMISLFWTRGGGEPININQTKTKKESKKGEGVKKVF